MPVLHNPKHEIFAQAIANGKSGAQAYVIAGYKPSVSNASMLRATQKVKARIAELIESKSNRFGNQLVRTEAAAIERTIERTAISKERIFNEFGHLAFSNMLDYMNLQADGTAVFDWSRLTRDQAAAIVEVTVEEFMDGRGEDARPVRRVKFKLADKIAALSKIGQELGMFIDRKHLDVSVEQRIAMMTDEQRLEEAKKLADRIRARLALEAPELIEGEATDVTPEANGPESDDDKSNER